MINMTRVIRRTLLVVVLLLICIIPFGASAQAQAAPAIDATKVAMDTMWTLLTAFLVFFMNLGFAMVESGLCRAKNTVNILAKNYIVFAISSVAFLLIGFGLMFGNGNGLVGMSGLWFASGADNSPLTGAVYQGDYSALNWTGIPLWAKFFFQLVFAGTAATIVSGAVAERIKFGAFFLFSFVMVGFIYPVVGHWIWGGGWAAQVRHVRFCGLHGRPLHRRLGGVSRRHDAGTAYRKIQRRQTATYSRAQYDVGYDRRLCAVVRLVRI